MYTKKELLQQCKDEGVDLGQNRYALKGILAEQTDSINFYSRKYVDDIENDIKLNEEETEILQNHGIKKGSYQANEELWLRTYKY